MLAVPPPWPVVFFDGLVRRSFTLLLRLPSVTPEFEPYEVAIARCSQTLARLCPAGARLLADWRNDDFPVLDPHVDLIVRFGLDFRKQRFGMMEPCEFSILRMAVFMAILTAAGELSHCAGNNIVP
jgi:hypothetical protein